MRCRLFFNGVNGAWNSYLSIFFLLMRGEYDAILHWPFTFKATFTLIDQSKSEDNQHHISASFWSNRQSGCFQRPHLEMNDAYGIENFFSFEQFQQNQHRYVLDDTMFIAIEVDFSTSIPPSNKISASSIEQRNKDFSVLVLPSDSGRRLINDEQHTGTIDDDVMRAIAFRN